MCGFIKKDKFASQNKLNLNKSNFSILFTLLYMTAMLRPVFPLIVYYANYDYIATELCENRNKPILDCNGICYLNKMIEKNNSQSNNGIVVPLNMDDYPISTLDFYKYVYSFQGEFKEVSNLFYTKHFVIKDYHNAIFRPPKLA